MSSSNELSDVEDPKPLMKPAVSRLFCCSVTAASGFIAAYALVAYAIALIYEVVWVVEAGHGLPIPAALLMLCYLVVITATVLLVHGLISKNNKCLLAWLIAVILVLIPECALVFYMSISYWGLQGVYGGAELACYVARLPAVVVGVVLVQSAYALREARKAGYPNAAAISGSEFDASHYVPDETGAFSNDGYLPDNGKSGSMPDLRRQLPSRQSMSMPYPPMGNMGMPPPAYWQHLAERHLAERHFAERHLADRHLADRHYATMRYPKPFSGPQMYGTWVGPRTSPYENHYKRRHSVVGAFDEYPAKNYDDYEKDRTESKSEAAFPYYRPIYYDRTYPYPPEYDPRFYPDYKREEAAYGVNLLRHDPYNFAERERVFYGLRNSHTSVGNESDDLGKYKDVAL